MVAKISYGGSLFGAASYNMDKVKEEKARIIEANRILEKLTEQGKFDMESIMKSFEYYLLANERVENPVVHISLNPDPKDQLTDEQYAVLAKDYLEQMGYKDQPFIVFRHEDIERHHIHIVTIRIKDDGSTISNSHDYHRSMKACRDLETKYGLCPALKKERDFNEDFIRKIDYEKGDIKRQISNTLKSLINTYEFQSLGEFNALLSCYNIHAAHVKGEKFGNQYNGIVYAATNDKGEIISNPLKSSLIGKSVGFEKLVLLMQKFAVKLKETDLTGQQQLIRQAMQTATSRNDFEQLLKQKGIDVIFRINDTGRIYGVTFVDHRNRTVLNGSRLGKDFSANVFNDFKWNGVQNQSTGKTVLPVFTPSNTQKHAQPSSDDDSSMIGDLNIFDFKPQGEDFEETAFARRMRKKKKGRKM